jgi:hypothetical protein
MGCSKNSNPRKVYYNKWLHQKRRKLSNRQSNFTSQRDRKRRRLRPMLAESRKEQRLDQK